MSEGIAFFKYCKIILKADFVYSVACQIKKEHRSLILNQFFDLWGKGGESRPIINDKIADLQRLYLFLFGGADGNDLPSVDRTLSSTGYPARKTKMLLSQHLTYFKPFAFVQQAVNASGLKY